jgi:acylglycerol lipase
MISSQGIFLSYRHADTAASARSLQLELRQRFRDVPVFMDLDSIKPGVEFPQEIREAVGSCAVLVALIGRQWATLADEQGHRRLDDPKDWVRLEIQAALGRGVPVIPVLVDDARPLRAEQLPAKLRKLAEIQAQRLSNDRYEYDVNQLLGRIQQVLATGEVTGLGNVRLHWRGWLPRGRVTGVVLLCHGAGEHSGRYMNVVNTLAPDGWAVYGLDHRGHGRSEGERVHVDRFSDWVADFDVFKREVAVRHREVPVFVLGHSLGGQIALAYALGHQQDLRGLVLSAPYLSANVPQIVQGAGRLAARFVSMKRVPLVDFGKISKDDFVVTQYRLDPLVYQGHPTLKMGVIVASQFDPLIDGSRSLRIPVLIQHGADDVIAKPTGSERLAKVCGSPDTTFRLYPGLWHEIYNEPERQRPLNDLREWLAKHR